jgi:hypothetical protein
MPSAKVEELRRLARESRMQARLFTNAETKKQMEAIADSYDRLADAEERDEAKAKASSHKRADDQ